MLRVRDILSTEYAKDFMLISGESGLTHIVKNIGINDYETLDDIPKVFGVGDFLLTSLALYKSDGDSVDIYLRAFMDAGVSAIGIKNVSSSEISKEVLDYSNRKQIPIIFTPKDIYTEDLIVFIKDMLRQSDEHSRFEQQVEKIMKGVTDERESENLMKEINPNHAEEISVYYFKKRYDDTDIEEDCSSLLYKFDELLPHLGIRIAKYEDGVFIFRAGNSGCYSEETETILCNYGFSMWNYTEGVYDYHIGISESIKQAFEKSMAAAYACIGENESRMRYENIGVYKYILPFNKESAVYNEYEKRFGRIVEYDAKNGTAFVKTALCYVKNNGEIKQTAEELYQHINTVRYRLRRIRELMDYQAEMYNEFYVDLVIMSKIYKLTSNGVTPFV